MGQSDQYKSQLHNFRVRSHEFNEAIKTNEIKKNNQVLLEKLLDISKGKNVSDSFPYNDLGVRWKTWSDAGGIGDCTPFPKLHNQEKGGW